MFIDISDSRRAWPSGSRNATGGLYLQSWHRLFSGKGGQNICFGGRVYQGLRIHHTHAWEEEINHWSEDRPTSAEEFLRSTSSTPFSWPAIQWHLTETTKLPRKPSEVIDCHCIHICTAWALISLNERLCGYGDGLVVHHLLLFDSSITALVFRDLSPSHAEQEHGCNRNERQYQPSIDHLLTFMDVRKKNSYFQNLLAPSISGSFCKARSWPPSPFMQFTNAPESDSYSSDTSLHSPVTSTSSLGLHTPFLSMNSSLFS